jgi:hypothetical protein
VAAGAEEDAAEIDMEVERQKGVEPAARLLMTAIQESVKSASQPVTVALRPPTTEQGPPPDYTPSVPRPFSQTAHAPKHFMRGVEGFITPSTLEGTAAHGVVLLNTTGAGRGARGGRGWSDVRNVAKPKGPAVRFTVTGVYEGENTSREDGIPPAPPMALTPADSADE